MKNSFRRALLDRQPTFGAWIHIGHARLRGGLAKAGADLRRSRARRNRYGDDDGNLSCHIQKHTVSVVGIPVNHSKWISPASFPTLKP